jgi:hypothetical protein
MTPTPKDNAKENAARIKQQRQDLLAAIRRTFDTPDGKRTLAWLHAATASGEPAFQAGRDGNFCPIAAAFRNGRQSVIQEIFKATTEAATPGA